MASSDTVQDRRLLQRGSRNSVNQPEPSADLPDLADNVAPPEEAELSKLREDLEIEKVARDETVKRALEAPLEPIAPPPPVAPLAEFEND